VTNETDYAMSGQQAINISYFSDVLCVWAYTAQIRLDELKHQFGERIRLSYHFIPVFGCTEQRIGQGWQDKGGFAGFGEHTRTVCRDFPHVQVSERVWTAATPRTSASCHHFIKSVQLLEQKGLISAAPRSDCDGRSLFEELVWRVRLAFFRDANDVAELDCLCGIANELGLPLDSIRTQMDNGEAMAQLCRDLELRDEYRVEGSPTYVLNEGRQKLYGNVGYKVIAANVEEVLNHPEDEASWC
jgi:predicted DsbA family dithiol-disulfide isomerase